MYYKNIKYFVNSFGKHSLLYGCHGKQLIIIFLVILSIQNTVYSQFSIKTDLSLGVNYATTYRRHLTSPDVKEILPSHSYATDINVQYTFLDSTYVVSFGVGFLQRPIIYILGDVDLSTFSEDCDFSSMTFSYDSFRRKQRYYFIEFPVYVEKKYHFGLGLFGGINFKLHQAGLLKADRIFERYSYKFFNWGLLLGMNYNINSRLSVSLKTDLEYMPFVTEDFFGTITVVSNFNTMLGISYNIVIK